MEFLTKPDPLEVTDNITENCKIFKRRWQNYAVGSEIDKKSAAIQKAVCLNLIGPEAEDLIASLSLAEDDSKTVDQLSKSLDDYVVPKTNTVFSRYQFFTRIQKEGEDFESFLLALKKLAENCQFEGLKMSLIRDRIIVGISNQQLRERLLGEEYDFDKVVKLCRSVETGKQRAQEMSTPAEVNWVSKPNRNKTSNSRGPASLPSHSQGTPPAQQMTKHPQPSQPSTKNIDCRYCGYKHPMRQCPAYGQQCTECNRYNHFPNMCAVSKRKKVPNDLKSKYQISQSANLISVQNALPVSKVSSSVASDMVNLLNSQISACGQDEINAEDFIYISEISVKPNQPAIINSVCNVSRATEKCWLEKLVVNNSVIDFKLDSGAEINIIPRHIFEKIKSPSDVLLPNRSLVLGYGGSQIDSCGHVVLDCKLLKKMFVVSHSSQLLMLAQLQC